MDIGPFFSQLELPALLVRGLAQITPQIWSDPPPLPPPPALQHWLFERPWTGGLGLLAAAALVFFVLRSRGKERAAGLAGGALGLAGVAVAAAGMLVTTERERIASLSADLVDAVARGDADAADRLLSDRLILDVGQAPAGEPQSASKDGPSADKRWALAGVALFRGQLNLSDRSVTLARAVMDGEGVGRTQVRVTVSEPKFGFGITWWEFTWRRDASGWRVRRLDLLTLNGKKPGGEVASELRSLTK